MKILTALFLILFLHQFGFAQSTGKIPADSMQVITDFDEFKVQYATDSLPLHMQELVLQNPYGTGFPLSYSVIYQGRLVALFKPGNFVCYTIPAFTRDSIFEKQLNSMEFSFHSLMDNKLVAKSGDKYYVLDNSNQWSALAAPVPFEGGAKLYEDTSYVVLSDCYGEWGGTVYFYNKATAKTYFTEAACANSVFKKDSQYFVLSNLGHMYGSSKLISVADPEKLPVAEPANKGLVHGQALGYTDSSNVANCIFDYSGLQLFSSFAYRGKTLYLVNLKGKTFLAELHKNRINVVNRLFNSNIYTHRPVTTVYNNLILINLDFYGIGGDREVADILIKDGMLIKLDWKDK